MADLNELPVPFRWKNILIAAVWFSKEHSPAHLSLRPLLTHPEVLAA